MSFHWCNDACTKKLADWLWKRTGMDKEGAHNMDRLAYELRDYNTMVSLFHWSRTYAGGVANVIWSFGVAVFAAIWGFPLSWFLCWRIIVLMNLYPHIPVEAFIHVLDMAVCCFFVVWLHRGTRDSSYYIQSVGGWWRRAGAWFWCCCERECQLVINYLTSSCPQKVDNYNWCW